MSSTLRPDMHPDLLRLCAAYDRLKAAQKACDGYLAPHAGPDWKAFTESYDAAKRELEAMFEQIKGSTR